MNEREFHEKTDRVFLKIEEWVEELNEDTEIESHGGVLTFTLSQGSQIVLSRQTALNEIWLAAKLGAFHFKYLAQSWVTQQGQLLEDVLCELFSQAIDEKVDLKDED